MGYGLLVWLPLWDAAFSIAVVNTGLLLINVQNISLYTC